MDDDELLEKEEAEKAEKVERMHERFKKPYGRLFKSDCDWYLNEHEFTADIKVIEGYVGLEDMSFDYILINGEQQGENAFGKAWIPGRNFGDNRLQTSTFLETVNEYKV
jgi:hypothetical protein